MTYPLQVKALKVTQPIGVYYVAVLPARVLLDVAFSHVMSAHLKVGQNTYELDGTQRQLDPGRLQLISNYINRIDAAFPNTIILAANYRKEDGRIEEEEPPEDDPGKGRSLKRWSISDVGDGSYSLLIPSGEKMAAIIDGQHRLFAYTRARADRLEMTLVCSVFLDLPKPIQAQLFATINSTQKQVPKSLTYELFGYNVEEEPEEFWSPDKLAVYLTRRLAADPESPLVGRIIVAPERDEELLKLSEGASWRISTAAVVEGIMRLYTSNPSRDTSDLLAKEKKPRKALADIRRDNSPLRHAYLKGEDAVVYAMVRNYLIACKETFWDRARPESFITRTVGMQAQFDVLRHLSSAAYEAKNISTSYFLEKLAPAREEDFADEIFRNASGTGRSLIRQSIMRKIGG